MLEIKNTSTTINGKKQISIQDFGKIKTLFTVFFAVIAAALLVADQYTLAANAKSVVTTNYGVGFLFAGGGRYPEISMIIGGYSFPIYLLLPIYMIYILNIAIPRKINRVINRALSAETPEDLIKSGFKIVSQKKRTFVMKDGKFSETSADTPIKSAEELIASGYKVVSQTKRTVIIKDGKFSENNKEAPASSNLKNEWPYA